MICSLGGIVTADRKLMPVAEKSETNPLCCAGAEIAPMTKI